MLASQSEKLAGCQARLQLLQEQFQAKLAEKHRIEDNARLAKAKMDQVCPPLSVVSVALVTLDMSVFLFVDVIRS